MKRIVLLLSLIFFLLMHSCKNETKKEETMANVIYRLEKVYVDDQEIRRFLRDSVDYNSTEAIPYKLKMKTIDSLNKIVVTGIIDKYGWLHNDSIGNKAFDALFLVIQHSDEETINKYFPLLKELHLKYGIAGQKVALMQDRILVRKGEKQIYGTQVSTKLNKFGDKLIWPIRNPDSVDILRKKMNINISLEEYAKRLGANYDRNVELPE